MLFSQWIILWVFFLPFYIDKCLSQSNHIFNYQSNIELKKENGQKSNIFSQIGVVEISSVNLADKNELILLNINLQNQLNFTDEPIAETCVLIRKNGLLEKLFVKKNLENQKLNLIKGLANILNLDDDQTEKMEFDINGECKIGYKQVNKNILRKIKTKCASINHDYLREKEDSYSIYNNSNIYMDYVYDENSTLLSIVGSETRILEPVLFQNLALEFHSSTILTLNKIAETSKPVLNDNNWKAFVNRIFNESFEEHFMKPLFYDDDNSKYLSREKFENSIKLIFANKKLSKNKMNLILELIRTFRKATSKRDLVKVIKMKNQYIHQYSNDILVNCGSRLCSEVLFDRIKELSKSNEGECIRILMILQNVRHSDQFLIKPLWNLMRQQTGIVYNQAVQTIASLIDSSSHRHYIVKDINNFIEEIQQKFESCSTNFCQLVHISAMKNSKLPEFYPVLKRIIDFYNKYSYKVVSSAVNSLFFLKFNQSQLESTRVNFYKFVDGNINNLNDSFLQYQCINTLILFKTDNTNLVNILDKLVIKSDDFQFFLVNKLKNLIELNILTGSEQILNCKLLRQSKFLMEIYPDKFGSQVTTLNLMETENALMDMHLSILGNSTAGSIKHSMTDVFLVSTLTENHLFSLNFHLIGLDSINSNSQSNSELSVEGYAQMILFGHDAAPIQLFEGYSGLLSSLWNAPTELTSIFQGIFLPIDISDQLIFQNGQIVRYNHLTSLTLDFQMKIESNIWYKTADSLVRTTGQAMTLFEYSLEPTASVKMNILMDYGLDISNQIDFSQNLIRKCPIMKMFPVKSQWKIDQNKIETSEKPGFSYSLSSSINRECSHLNNSN